MNGVQIGYARVSTTDRDFTAQRDALLRLGVQESHIFVDHGMTGANRARPGLREALAGVRSGDTLVVTKLDRLARSVRDARDITDEVTTKGVARSLGGSRYDRAPTLPAAHGWVANTSGHDHRRCAVTPHHVHPRLLRSEPLGWEKVFGRREVVDEAVAQC